MLGMNTADYKKQKIKPSSKRCGTVQKKVLLIALAGIAFGLSRSPKQQFKIVTSLPEELRKLGPSVPRSIRKLYDSKLLKKKINKDGAVTLILSNQGRKQALTYKLEKMKLPKHKKWDGKWRIVMYDIPEYKRSGRNSLRSSIVKAGMCEMQQSVFVYPYECKKEVDFIVELYGLSRYVRYAELSFIDNELHLKKTFNI